MNRPSPPAFRGRTAPEAVRGTVPRAGGRTPAHGAPPRAPGGPFIRLAAVYSLDILRVCSCRATSAIEPDSDG